MGYCNQQSRRLIFIDIETTGLYHHQGEKIIQIAFTDCNKRVLNYNLNPDGRPIS